MSVCSLLYRTDAHSIAQINFKFIIFVQFQERNVILQAKLCVNCTLLLLSLHVLSNILVLIANILRLNLACQIRVKSSKGVKK